MLVAVGSHIASQFAAQRIRHDWYRWSCYATVKNPIVSSSSASPPLRPQARTHEHTSTTMSMQRAWETHVKRHRICAWCSRERNEIVSMSLPWERSKEKNGVSEGLDQEVEWPRRLFARWCTPSCCTPPCFSFSIGSSESERDNSDCCL